MILPKIRLPFSVQTTLTSMKLKINKPCNEDWDKMTPDAQGRFCNQCSKSVIDFTVLPTTEIIQLLESSHGNVCGRLTSSQLKHPYLSFKPVKQSSIPYSRIAANVMLVASAFGAQSCNTTTGDVTTEIHSTLEGEGIKIGEVAISSNDNSTSNHQKSMLFSGTVTSLMDNNPIHNATIEFITLTHVYSVLSDSLGNFSFEIPQEAINKKNIVRTTFGKVTQKSTKTNGEVILNHLYFYKSHDYILSIEQLLEPLKIKAEQEIMILGKMVHHAGEEIELDPVVLDNGKEVPYKEFQKSQMGEKTSCNLAGKEYYYFDKNSAIALYGQKARGGLFLFMDSSKVKL
ncbi:MAG: hypothetical protein COA58_00715 [Bacteroidetes bacterium]|nr:MAG: hypothetical protein COA58_00715 [Bacteroidota bacterium]